MKGHLGTALAMLSLLTVVAACSPAAAPGGGHGAGKSAQRLAHTAKKAGQEGRHSAHTAAKSITRDVKRLPGKAARGTRRLAREGRHTVHKLGMAGKGMTAAATGRRGAAAAGAPLKVIGFVTPGSATGPMGAPGLSDLARTPQAVTYLAPLFYSVRADGSLTSHYVAGVVAFAHAHHIKVMPLVNNAGGNHTFLEDPTARRKAVDNIASTVETRHFDGISIDFQLLPSTSRVALETFMDELSSRLRPLGKTITVNVIPTAAQTGSHGAYNEHALMRYADQIILMTYDRHNDASAPGPVSPHAWVVAAVKHALQEGVPPQKLYIGVNTYGYTWNTTKGTAMTIPLKAAKVLPHVHWDAAVKEAHATYRTSTGVHVAWFGNEASLKDKIAIARKYHLYGLAVWRVGYEDRSFWKTLAAENGNAAATAAARRTRPLIPNRPAPNRAALPITGTRRPTIPPHRTAPSRPGMFGIRRGPLGPTARLTPTMPHRRTPGHVS